MSRKLQIKRGNKVNLPDLDHGELAVTLDTGELYVGTSKGNILVGSETFTQQLAEIVQHNVIKHGADKNGVNYSDGALTSINSILQDGEKITFPKGKYKFSQNVIITKDVEVDFGNSEFEFDSSEDGFIFRGTLKSTKTVTANYVESTSKNSLVLSDVTGIAIGDLVSVVSTELFNPSRSYYYKGGNALITGITGNTVYFNLVFPFDMTASSITVKIYKPIKVNLKNIKMLKNTQHLDYTHRGILIEYGANCKLDSIETDNFKRNIELLRCVNVSVNNVKTGHAKNTNTDFSCYGICLLSCTNIVFDFITTNSGQHGLTTGGEELCYGIKINNSTLKAETWNLGLGLHRNIFDIEVNNSTLYGFIANGNFVMNNCQVLKGEIDSNNASRLGFSIDKRYSNYTFNDCSIEPTILVSESSQIVNPTDNKIGNIVFNNCPKLTIFTRLKLDNTIGKVLEIEHLEVNKAKWFELTFYDKVKKLLIVDSNSVAHEYSTLTQGIHNGTYEKIDEVYIVRTKFGNRAYDINLFLCGKVLLDSVSYNNTRYGTLDTGSWAFKKVDDLSFMNVDMRGAERGIEDSDTLGNMNIYNSKIKYRNQGQFDFDLVEAQTVNIFGMTNLLTGAIENYLTASDGKVYKQTIDATGVQVLTLIG